MSFFKNEQSKETKNLYYNLNDIGNNSERSVKKSFKLNTDSLVYPNSLMKSILSNRESDRPNITETKLNNTNDSSTTLTQMKEN